MNPTRSSYSIINIAFFVLISGVLLYFRFYPNLPGDIQLKCQHELLTGEKCVSCGLSRAMALLMRGNFDEAQKINSQAVPLFFFLLIQWFLRAIFFILNFRNYLCTRKCILFDGIISILFFVYLIVIR